MRCLPVLTIILITLAFAGAEDTKKSKVVDLPENINKVVGLDGVLSQTPSQHIVASYPDRNPEYFDLDDGGQIVIYVPAEFECLERAHIVGKVIPVSGGGKENKSQDRFTEYHIDVQSWQCFDNDEVSRMLDRLVDPARTSQEKAPIANDVVQMGKTAIPTLIQHLSDTRICWKERRLLNEAELTNRPANASSSKEKWADDPVSVARLANRLLLRIITPQYESPYQSNLKPFSIGPESWMFRIEDWRSWWAAARYKSMLVIHEQMKKVIDAYWQAHGTEQLVR